MARGRGGAARGGACGAAVPCRQDAFARNRPDAEEVRIPRICDKCLEEAVPAMVELACGKTPRYVWGDVPSCFGAAPKESGEGVDPGGSGMPKPDAKDPSSAADALSLPTCSKDVQACRIGILGNALHCFDPLASDDLQNLLRSLGCEPVLPDPCNLVSDDVRYGKQLESFRKQGVDGVVYVHSFGCMKANVQVRGQMHRLKAGCASGRARMLCECEQCARTGCARSLPYASASGPAAGPSLLGREPRPLLNPSE